MSNVVAVESREHFDALLSTNEVVIVKCWAVWCGPCKALKPVFEAVAEASDALFVEIDVDSNPWVMVRYDVMSVPTMLLFRNGQLVTRLRQRRAIPLLNEIDNS